jgi:hypothetical protein
MEKQQIEAYLDQYARRQIAEELRLPLKKVGAVVALRVDH